MTHASLFSGIGGPEVAAAMMGWRNAFHCEINPFGRAVLDYWFPDSTSYEDITKTDFREWRGKIDVLTGGFPCQPFSYAGKRGGGQKTHVTSGRRCSALLTKSGPLGSLVKMLLESPQWSKAGYYLRWEARRLYSERWTEFSDTDCVSPSPSNASAATLRVSDIPSSRCLFQLRLSELPIDETESSSLPIMIPTPRTCSAMAASLNTKGNLEGNRAPNLETVVGRMLLPSPRVSDMKGGTTKPRKDTGRVRDDRLDNMAALGLLPSPTARDYKNPSSPDGARIARKVSQGWTIELNDLAAMRILPTPSARDWKPPYNEDAMIRKDGMVRDDMLSSLPTMLGLKERGGITFRLSPLFTQEMMGFPFGWTELPFLPQCNPRITEIPIASATTSGAGAQNRSKHTETP